MSATMSADRTYHGYASYQTWNVVLWISNNQSLNHLAARCLSYNEFVEVLREMDRGKDLAYETPDGVAWKDSSVNLSELQEYWEESFSRVPA
jgi:hypothetical protein